MWSTNGSALSLHEIAQEDLVLDELRAINAVGYRNAQTASLAGPAVSSDEDRCSLPTYPRAPGILRLRQLKSNRHKYSHSIPRTYFARPNRRETASQLSLLHRSAEFSLDRGNCPRQPSSAISVVI